MTVDDIAIIGGNEMNLVHRISASRRLNEDTFLLSIKSPEIATAAKPGQFVNIRCSEGLEAYLRRPISICSVDREKGLVDIGVQIRGKGTEALCRFNENAPIDLMGPLGNGFSLNKSDERIAVIGGGIGVFPLLQLLKEHPAARKTALLGFRNKEAVVLEKEFSECSDALLISTDDGSYGIKGFVTAILEKKLVEERFNRIYMCGPTVMMKHAVRICLGMGIPAEVSLEQRMGCGIGACLVCACRTKSGDDWDYSHVCKDGPVFDASKVIFD